FATLLAHQTHCALPDFRRKLGYLLVHGSILSTVGASTIPGAVHSEFIIRPALNRFIFDSTFPLASDNWLEFLTNAE
ncbi:hypothetical protein, partial [Paraburkholderia caledonica]|uniref:hypothetical protein n=1 Tax=Paraburkholderia caledonica TaxID=134536 RepID=UPI00370982F0